MKQYLTDLDIRIMMYYDNKRNKLKYKTKMKNEIQKLKMYIIIYKEYYRQNSKNYRLIKRLKNRK